jgi:hypothetical protein
MSIPVVNGVACDVEKQNILTSRFHFDNRFGCGAGKISNMAHHTESRV